MKVRAHSKAVRISPRKVGIVASLVRNRSVEDALTILDHTPRRAAPTIAKIIESARSNAENNHNIKPDTLVISDINIGPAQSMRRYRPAAHGRANPYKRRSTHITVIVEGQQRVKKAKKKADKAEKTDKAQAKESK
ncbi:MAG: 50S ribosomal protein L22 [Candidatus Saccharimonadales bacterium]|nr:50S ribosomal protein L22 [Candidatus Saccharimonadales bacterium]